MSIHESDHFLRITLLVLPTEISHQGFRAYMHSLNIFLLVGSRVGNHLWSAVRLQWHKLLQRYLDSSLLNDLFKRLPLLRSHLVVVLIIDAGHFWLLFSKINI